LRDRGLEFGAQKGSRRLVSIVEEATWWSVWIISKRKKYWNVYVQLAQLKKFNTENAKGKKCLKMLR
jgi:hypothetical protein